MIVGFMRNFATPPYMAKLTAILCKYQGIDLIYLNPRGVNMEKNTVKGKMFIDNTWVSVQTDLPSFIDISPYCFKARNENIIKYLRKKTLLSDDRTNRLTKEDLQNELKKDDKFSELVIPTFRVQNISDIKDFLHKYSTIVMKPIGGERGRGVYVLSGETNSYILGYQKKEKMLTDKELIAFFEEHIKDKRYILQKYIASRSIQGDPFDCRIHVEKNGEGKWVSARNFIRIGIGQKIVSNVSQGGGISDPEAFLKANYGDDWQEINRNLNKLAITLPYKIEELRKTKIMTLGMDIGIDEDGKPYLFEVNSAPITAPLRAEAAMLRVDYYKYVLERKANQDLIELRNLEKENRALKENYKILENANKKYKEKYQAVLDSKAWKATSPIRIAGRFAKRKLKKQR